MDNHPIPQDVTGFQFKLIGNMTVKQFAYLATGITLAGITYKLPIYFLIRFPLCAIFALVGTGLAYFPISGRPMDVMIGNYIKALFRPTQFVYEKLGGQIYFPNKTLIASMGKNMRNKVNFSMLPKDKLKIYLDSLDTKQKNVVDEKENHFLMSVSNLAAKNTPSQPNTTSNQNVSRLNLQPNLAQQTYSAIPLKNQHPIEVLAKHPSPPTAQPSGPAISQGASFTKVAAKMRPSREEKKNAEPPAKGFNRTIGMPNIPNSPNLITGITKDARGNDLSNILVEIKDKDGNPVRAFKTNEFGRFASATSLANGTYTVEFEDPQGQNRFGKIAINATGQIILPIEAISVDMREELRMSLFPTSAPAPRGAPIPGGAQVN